MGEIKKEEEKRWRQGRERGIQSHMTLHRGVGMQFIRGGGGGGLTCYDKLLCTGVQNIYKPKIIN